MLTQVMDKVPCYYLPGRGGRIDRGLGAELVRQGYEVSGREVTPRERNTANSEFGHLQFQEQVDLIQHDLLHHDHDGGLVIAHSFGAYLLLHALLGKTDFLGHCLLISPITGSATTEGMYFRPPAAKILEQAIDDQYFQRFKIRVLVGGLDNQSNPERCKGLVANMSTDLVLLKTQGHQLNHDDVSGFITSSGIQHPL
jgi:predicted alpha/beta hydrolase family esterase